MHLEPLLDIHERWLALRVPSRLRKVVAAMARNKGLEEFQTRSCIASPEIPVSGGHRGFSQATQWKSQGSEGES